MKLPSARSFFIILLCLGLCVSLLYAESAVLVPREVFVGDTAELSFDSPALKGALDAASAVTVKSTDFPVSPEVTINSIQVFEKDGSALVLIRFIPWAAGVLQLPSFSIQKIRVVPPPVRISSLIEKTGRTALEPPRSPLLIPGTTYLLYGFIALCIILASALIFAFVKIRNSFAGTRKGTQSKRRIRFALKQLRHLERIIQKTGSAEWYRRYASFLRTYFGMFCMLGGESFASATGTEIISGIGKHFDSREGGRTGVNDIISRLRTLLTRIDTLRFSAPPVSDTCALDIETARTLIQALEDGWEALDDQL